MSRPDLFGEDGRRIVAEHGTTLFPPAVRPPFIRLLWTVLAVVASAGTIVVLMLHGRLG